MPRHTLFDVPLNSVGMAIIYAWTGRSTHTHSLLPLQFNYGQKRVYPCNLSCLDIKIVGRKECTPTLFAAPLIYLWAGKSVPLHSLLPEYSRQERVYPRTLCCPIIFKLGKKHSFLPKKWRQSPSVPPH